MRTVTRWACGLVLLGGAVALLPIYASDILRVGAVAALVTVAENCAGPLTGTQALLGVTLTWTTGALTVTVTVAVSFLVVSAALVATTL